MKFCSTSHCYQNNSLGLANSGSVNTVKHDRIMAGQLLGDRYQIERELGRQSGRWTLLAQDLHAKERVVIKLLCADASLRTDDLKLFDREVEILKALSHPSIPKYLGSFRHRLPGGWMLALVQTYVGGRSLADQLQAKRQFNEAEAKQVAKSLLYILIYLQRHKPPIVHRDIKPSNIVLSDRKIHLVDFGSIKTILSSPDSTTAYTQINTHDYTPPEQFAGRSLIASDLYSLGLTVITTLTGIPPAQMPRSKNRIALHGFGLSPAFADWLAWMTETSLDRRLGSATEALQALDAAQVRDT